MCWRRKWQPTPVFLPGESQGWGAWWAAVYGVAQSWTWLKPLSSSSSRQINKLPRWLSDKESTWQCRRCRFDPWVGKILWEEGMAIHSSILARIIPGTEEPGGLQSMGLQRVRHHWGTRACTQAHNLEMTSNSTVWGLSSETPPLHTHTHTHF